MSDTPDTWLSLDEAAGRLGVSRIRIREAIAAGLVSARRDNRGLWRVSLGGDLDQTRRRMETARLAPEALVGLLFDEIEEMNLLLADRDASLDRLKALVERQDGVIARALSLAEAPPAGQSVDGARLSEANDRSLRLIETTLDKLAGRDADIGRLAGLVERSLTTIAGLEAEMTRQTQIAERQKGLLEKLFSLAETSIERFARSDLRTRGFVERLRDRFRGGADS
jgi:hypothetical protein